MILDHSPLLKVCAAMKKNMVRYMVVGGYACALNGHMRMTEDVDLLLDSDVSNLERAIKSVHELLPSIKDEIAPQDILENVVLKIVDYLEIDLSVQARTVDFSDVESDIRHVEIEGVDIPYTGIDGLIKSKETMREIDLWDVKVLRELKIKKRRINV